MLYITTKEAAEILNLEYYQNVNTLLRQGKLKGKKFGTTWQVNKKSVLERKAKLNKA